MTILIRPPLLWTLVLWMSWYSVSRKGHAADTPPAAATAPSTSTSTSTSTTTTATSHSMWLISTRHLPNARATCVQDQTWEFQQCDGHTWRQASAADFHATDRLHERTCILVHGNRMEPEDAYRHGALMFRQLHRSPQPFRFIVWSWPSDRIRGPVRDVRVKAGRADAEAVYLGRFLRDLPPQTPVTLIGYSFGARAVVGCLHALALDPATSSREPHHPSATHPRTIVMAAAFPTCWISGNGRWNLAAVQAESFVSFYNPRDPALKLYRLAATKEHADLLGTEYARLGFIEQFNVGGLIGATHGFDDYVSSAPLMSTFRARVFAETSSH